MRRTLSFAQGQGERASKLSSLTWVVLVNTTDRTAAVPQAVGGSAQHSERARRELRDYANRVRNNFQGQSTTLHTLARYLRELEGFDDAARRARIRQKTKVVSFLKQFPEFFTVTSTLGRGDVTVA